MRCAFSTAAVIAGDSAFIRMTAAISEPDQSDNYHFLKVMAYAFFQLKTTKYSNKNKIWKIEIIKKKTKTMNPETESE